MSSPILKEHLNLPYFPSDHQKHQLDLYRPAEEGTFPVVLFVHGGGWKNGDRRWRNIFMVNLYQNVGITLSKQGFVCTVISYRLSAVEPLNLLISVPILAIFLSFLVIIFGGLLNLFCMFIFKTLPPPPGCSTEFYRGRKSENWQALRRKKFSVFFSHNTPHMWNIQVYKIHHLRTTNFLSVDTGVFYWIISNLVYIFLACVSLTSFMVCMAFVRQGEVTVRHPDHVSDVARAYKWITENIHQYGGDPNNIFLMGHSAGGHLVSLLALDHTYLNQLNTPTSNIRGVIGLSGVYNLGRLRKMGWLARWWYLYPLFGTNLLREILYSASPLTYVHKTGFNFLLVNAKVDMHLSKDAEEFATALLKKGVEVERFLVNGTHLASVAEIGKKKDTLTPCIVEWMRRQMKGVKNGEMTGTLNFSNKNDEFPKTRYLRDHNMENVVGDNSESGCISPELQSDIERAANEIINADCLLFCTGSGMSAESGLPTFRDPDSFASTYPALAARGFKTFSISISEFDDSPESAWGFWITRYNKYQNAIPHQGYKILLNWATEKKNYFACTSNIDGQLQKAGFPTERVFEFHGSISWLQCSKLCQDIVWPIKTDTFPPVNQETLLPQGPLPKCIFCGAPARPNVMWAGDILFSGHDYKVQRERYYAWLGTLKPETTKLVIIEIGAGTEIATIRNQSEIWAKEIQHSLLVRINPKHTEVPPGQISLPLTAVEGLLALDKAIQKLK